MSKNSKWEAYLDERPEFRKWCEYQQDISKSDTTLSTYMDRINRIHDGCNSVPIHPYYLPPIIEVSKMNDGQVLEYAADGGWEYICPPVDVLSKRVVPMPGITFDEAKTIQNLHEQPAQNENNHFGTEILDILCARKMGTSPYDQKTTNKANIAYTIMRMSPSLVEDMDSFIRFSCEYGHAYMFGSHYSLINQDGAAINNDFIDRLLEPKPEPSEISEDEWNDRSRVLTSLADSYASGSGRDGVTFIHNLLRALSAFFNRNQENIVFVETVYDFIMNTLDTTDMDTVKYRPGILDVRIFDSLRTYGASFAAPFLERAYDTMK